MLLAFAHSTSHTRVRTLTIIVLLTGLNLISRSTFSSASCRGNRVLNRLVVVVVG